MALSEKQIAQARENSTSAVSVYSPGAGVTGIVTTIHIANTSGAAATFRLFHDDDGATYNESTAIAWNSPISADEFIQITGHYAVDESGNFAYRSSVANALTITLYGAEIT